MAHDGRYHAYCSHCASVFFWHVLPGEVLGVPDREMGVPVVEKVDLPAIEGVVFEIWTHTLCELRERCLGEAAHVGCGGVDPLLFISKKSVAMFAARMPQSDTIKTAQAFFLDVVLNGNEVDGRAHLVLVLFHPLENEAQVNFLVSLLNPPACPSGNASWSSWCGASFVIPVGEFFFFFFVG